MGVCSKYYGYFFQCINYFILIISFNFSTLFIITYLRTLLKKKNLVNWDSHNTSSLILPSSFFEEVGCSILASLQRKLRRYIEFQKFDVTIKKIKKLKLV